MSKGGAHWLTKKWRKRILKRLYYAADELNHAKDCAISRELEKPHYDFDAVFGANATIPCTCGCRDAGSAIFDAIKALRL